MKRLAALEGLRGYAAFLVFLVHSFGLILLRLYPGDPDQATVLGSPWPQDGLVFFFRSHYGVDLFFVLSGLLMADIAARRWPGTRTFLARRAMRIYPAYVASGLVTFLAGIWIFHRSLAPVDIAANAALLPGFFLLGFPILNPTTWSLSYEVAFYLAVPLLAAAFGRAGEPGRPRAPWVLAASFVAIIVASASLPGEKTIYFAYFALFVPGLALGMLDAESRGRAARRLPAWLALAAWIAFTLAFKLRVFDNTAPAYYVASAAACGLVVLKACDTSSPLARALSSAAPRALGRISYSFFLVHFIVVHAFGRVLEAAFGLHNRIAFASGVLIGGFVLSLACAWVLFIVAERFYFRGQ